MRSHSEEKALMRKRGKAATMEVEPSDGRAQPAGEDISL